MTKKMFFFLYGLNAYLIGSLKTSLMAGADLSVYLCVKKNLVL